MPSALHYENAAYKSVRIHRKARGVPGVRSPGGFTYLSNTDATTAPTVTWDPWRVDITPPRATPVAVTACDPGLLEEATECCPIVGDIGLAIDDMPEGITDVSTNEGLGAG